MSCERCSILCHITLHICLILYFISHEISYGFACISHDSIHVSCDSHASSQRLVDVVEVVPEKGVIGKRFRKDAKPILEKLSSIVGKEAELMDQQTSAKG